MQFEYGDLVLLTNGYTGKVVHLHDWGLINVAYNGLIHAVRPEAIVKVVRKQEKHR